MQNPPVSVIIVSSSYPRYSGDAASVFIKHLAGALANTGISVSVVAPGPGETTNKPGNNPEVFRFRYFFPGLERLAYGSGILPNLKRNPFLWIEVPFFVLTMFLKTLVIARRLRPDVIHAHWILPQGLVALIIGFILKIPVITTAHGADAFGLNNRFLTFLKRLVIRHSDAWTSNTDTTAASFTDTTLRANYRKVPMGVDVIKFSQGNPSSLRTMVAESKTVILFVGRLVKKKGVDSLIKAFSLLPSPIKNDAILWIIGDGDQQSLLVNLTRSLGIQNSVSFLGQIDNDSLPDYYAAADLFVGPSTTTDYGDTEGQGIVFAEAAASRLCVLATNSGGIPEVIVSGKTGILVPPDNIFELSSQMARLLSDKELRDTLANNAFRNVSNKFSWNIIADQFRDLYISVRK